MEAAFPFGMHSVLQNSMTVAVFWQMDILRYCPCSWSSKEAIPSSEATAGMPARPLVLKASREGVT